MNFIKKYWIVFVFLIGIGGSIGWMNFNYDSNYCYKNMEYMTDEQYIDIAVHRLDEALEQVFLGYSSYEKIKDYLKVHPENISFYRNTTDQFEWVTWVVVKYDFDEEERKKLKEKRDNDFIAFSVNFTFDECGDYLDTGEQTTPYKWLKNTKIKKEQ